MAATAALGTGPAAALVDYFVVVGVEDADAAALLARQRDDGAPRVPSAQMKRRPCLQQRACH